MNFPKLEKTTYEGLLNDFELDQIILLMDIELSFYHQLYSEVKSYGYNDPNWSIKVLEDLQQLERYRKVRKIYNKKMIEVKNLKLYI